MKFGGKTMRFGYKLDYDAEIDEDLREIRRLEFLLEHRLWDMGHIGLPEAAMYPDVAKRIGLPEEQRNRLAFFVEGECFSEPEFRYCDESAITDPRKDDLEGERVYERLEALYSGYLVRDEATLKADRRRAKAALARHRRNKGKFG